MLFTLHISFVCQLNLPPPPPPRPVPDNFTSSTNFQFGVWLLRSIRISATHLFQLYSETVLITSTAYKIIIHRIDFKCKKFVVLVNKFDVLLLAPY